MVCLQDPDAEALSVLDTGNPPFRTPLNFNKHDSLPSEPQCREYSIPRKTSDTSHTMLDNCTPFLAPPGEHIPAYLGYHTTIFMVRILRIQNHHVELSCLRVSVNPAIRSTELEPKISHRPNIPADVAAI